MNKGGAHSGVDMMRHAWSWVTHLLAGVYGKVAYQPLPNSFYPYCSSLLKCEVNQLAVKLVNSPVPVFF